MQKNGEKVPANNFKITLNIIIWPVLDTSTVVSVAEPDIDIEQGLPNKKFFNFFIAEICLRSFSIYEAYFSLRN